MDAMDAVWEELTSEVASGELSGVDRRAWALERLGEDVPPARLREQVRDTLERFWDLVQVDPTRALGQATLAEAVIARLGGDDLGTRGELALRRATALFALGRAGQASGATGEALTALRAAGAPADAADAEAARNAGRLRAGLLGLQANALLAQGRAAEALVAVEEALALARTFRLEAAEGMYLSTLGTARLVAGDLRAAEEYYGEALRVARRHSNREGEVVNLGNLGLVHHVTGELQAALGDYRQALALARRLGDRRTASSLEANIGQVLADQGDLEGATRHFDVALELAQSLSDRVLEALAQLRLAAVARERGAFEEAARRAEEAEEWLEAVGDPRLAAVWCEAGRVHLERGDAAAAKALFARALERAEQAGDRRSAAAARHDLARATLRLNGAGGASSAALADLDLALEAATDAEDRALVSAVQLARCEALAAAGRVDGARAALRAAERALPRPRPLLLGARLRLAEAGVVGLSDAARGRSIAEEVALTCAERGYGALAAEVERRLAGWPEEAPR